MTNTNELATIDLNTLETVNGGDFASKYVNNLKQDAKDWWNREKATASDLKAHHWGSAAKNFGAVLLDEVGTVGDAIAPIKALK